MPGSEERPVHMRDHLTYAANPIEWEVGNDVQDIRHGEWPTMYHPRRAELRSRARDDSSLRPALAKCEAVCKTRGCPPHGRIPLGCQLIALKQFTNAVPVGPGIAFTRPRPQFRAGASCTIPPPLLRRQV